MGVGKGVDRADLWSVDLEVAGRLVRVRERRDRLGLWLYWYEAGGRRQPRLIGLDTVRKKDGSIDSTKERKAESLALRQFRSVSGGHGQEAPNTEEQEGLTLEQGIDLALSPKVGKYPSKTARHKEVRRIRDRILEALPPDLLWTDLRARHYRLIWRTFIDRRKDWGQGWRMAEIAVSAIAAIGSWLLDEDHIENWRGPRRGWRAELRKEWQEATRKPSKPARPRHTDAEMDVFWDGLDESVDPRLRLAAEVGAEFRIGQVIRCDRSDLDLSRGAGAGFGTLEIHGLGRKPGALVFLSAGQRVVVDAALRHDGPARGHLAEYERAFQGGKLQDYPLFPAGRLSKGMLHIPPSGQPAGRMARRNLLKLYTAYEKKVGIRHVPGRAWYGIRRRSSDRMRRVTADERVRDAAGGWTAGSSTRERIYMDGQDPEVLKETASLRDLARGREAEERVGAMPADLEVVLRSMGIPDAKVRALLIMAAPDS